MKIRRLLHALKNRIAYTGRVGLDENRYDTRTAMSVVDPHDPDLGSIRIEYM